MQLSFCDNLVRYIKTKNNWPFFIDHENVKGETHKQHLNYYAFPKL